MLSEKEMEILKNGAYGVTRDGRKALYAGTDGDDEHIWLLFMRSNPIMPEDFEVGYASFNKYNYTDISNLDIIGLWEDKPEPFNLERALAGEPVLLKSGEKAFVLNNIEPLMYSNYPLIGVDNNGEPLHWDKTGICGSRGLGGELNIIGMWKEPEPINSSDNELPKPIKDFGDLAAVWFVELDDKTATYTPCCSRKGNGWMGWQQTRLNKGVYYATREDCQKICDWLMNR